MPLKRTWGGALTYTASYCLMLDPGHSLIFETLTGKPKGGEGEFNFLPFTRRSANWSILHRIGFGGHSAYDLLLDPSDFLAGQAKFRTITPKQDQDLWRPLGRSR